MKPTFIAGPSSFQRQKTDENGVFLFDEKNQSMLEDISFSKQYVLLKDEDSSILLPRKGTYTIFEEDVVRLYYNGQRHCVEYEGSEEDCLGYNKIINV